MRLQPGIFIYKDGTAVDCSLKNMYFRNMSGIYEYKLYFQSPPYALGEKPEGGGAGSADNLFFENVSIIAERNSRYPIDVPVTGYFGMFFMNSHIGYISLEDIHYTVGEDKIFRPAAWNAFGMDKEGQDFRACATYGPMYK